MSCIRTSFTPAIVCMTIGLLLSSPQAFAQANSWTNPLGDKWEVAGNWSLGIVPDAGQSVLITNSPAKIVTIDQQTAALLTNDLAVNSMVIGGVGNRVLIADISPVAELVVGSGIGIEAGCELAITNASLHVGGGGISVDGFLRLDDAAIAPTNEASLSFVQVGNDSSATGVVQVSGTVVLPQLRIGTGGFGQLVVSNGSFYCSFLSIGLFSTGQVVIAGGRLTNHGTMTFGQTGQGAGMLFMNGGEFNTPTFVFPGGSGLGTGTGMIVISNGVAHVGSIDIVNGGSMSIVGGELDLGDHLRLRECGVNVVLAGSGVLAATNAQQTGLIEIAAGTLTMNGGTLIADRLISTNPCARFIRNSGTLMVGEVVLCSNALSPTAAAVPSTGETGSLTVIAADYCGWTGETVEDWIHVTGSGAGTGTVSYTVDSNVSNCAPRSGSIDVAGSIFTIDQAAGAGVFRLFPTDRLHHSASDTGAISVIASSDNCGWSATNGAAWVTITSANVGTGNGTVEYSITTTTNSLDRVTTITIASETFTVTQSGAGSLDVTHLRARLDFKKPNADSCKLRALPNPDNCTNLTGVAVKLDVGGAQVAFTLDAKGRGVSTNGTCRLSYNEKTTDCAFKAKLRHGAWQTPWAVHGLVNVTIAKTGTAVTLPVILVIGDQAFMTDKPLHYSATAGKSGLAK